MEKTECHLNSLDNDRLIKLALHTNQMDMEIQRNHSKDGYEVATDLCLICGRQQKKSHHYFVNTFFTILHLPLANLLLLELNNNINPELHSNKFYC
jgi:hypothetical protein